MTLLISLITWWLSEREQRLQHSLTAVSSAHRRGHSLCRCEQDFWMSECMCLGSDAGGKGRHDPAWWALPTQNSSTWFLPSPCQQVAKEVVHPWNSAFPVNLASGLGVQSLTIDYGESWGLGVGWKEASDLLTFQPLWPCLANLGLTGWAPHRQGWRFLVKLPFYFKRFVLFI